ncbi:MAG: phosphoesterase [Bacteroidota bacterium]
MRITAIFFVFLLHLGNLFAQKTISFNTVPAGDAYNIINPKGASIIPSGRFITPAGHATRIARAAFGLAVSPDENQLLILHQIGLVTVVDPRKPDDILYAPSLDGKRPAVGEAAFLGAAYSKDGKTAYLSGGDKGTVVVIDPSNLSKKAEITLDGVFNGKKFEDSFTSDLTIDYQHNELLILDRGNNRMVRYSLTDNKITASIPVGRIPFGISLSPDGNYAFVANVGLYDYPLIPGVTPTNKDTMMIQFPAYGALTKEAEHGVTLPDGRFIPGLGNAMADEAMSVWVVDLKNNTVKQKLKTGYQIGEKIEGVEIVGGASPNSVAVGSKYAYVSNASNDLISIIDYKNGKIVGEIKVANFDKIAGVPKETAALLAKHRGMMPFGLSLSHDEKTLYVALLGFNAVAVIDVQKKKTKALIPTGWGTTRVAVSKNDQKLFILSARGYGAGPNGGKGFVAPPYGTYIGDIQLGILQIVDNATDAASLKNWTKQTLDNTFKTIQVTDDGKNPCPPAPGLRKSPIKHIVYITKENRTYDEMFAQIPEGKGDVTLARFGLDVPLMTKKDTLKKVSISPNHHKIGQKWAMSDNFYCDSDASIHGHHWMMGTVPNEYVEANSASDARFLAFSSAPGRRFPKTTGAIDPEDYNEIGGIWENLERNHVSYYNFGEANEYASSYEEWNNTQIGTAHPVPFPMPNAAFTHTCHDYAGFNCNIPDQFRADQFEKAFTDMWLTGKAEMPAFIGIQLPNDHTSDPRPEDGYPFIHSFVADNDLALGRMLQFLSKTPYWKDMLVIVTEDDPQGGVDHIDAHRSVLLLAGPYVKQHYMSHKHANFGSIIRTIYTILDIPAVNQYDATASLLDDFFTDKPNLTPYSVLPHDPQVFQPEMSLKKYGKTFDWRKIQGGAKLDDEMEQRKEHYRQQGGR